MLICLGIFSAAVCFASPELVEEKYIVKDGDTLDSITHEFIIKNTYGIREFREFREGIKEVNEIIDDTVHPGQVLQIFYWQ